jgi:hypothetical protein
MAYQYDKVNRVEIDSPRGPVVLEKDGVGWKLTAPESWKADTGAVNNVLWKVRDLRAIAFLDEDAAAVSRYLAKPELTVKIWEEGAKDPKVLLLAPSRETRSGQPAAVAAVAGRGPVILVEGKALAEIGRAPSDLRDKTLMPAFEPADVKRARLTAGGSTVTVERKGESDWQMVEPKRGATKERKVADLVFALKALRWKEIASPKGEDAPRFGLDKPNLEVTLFKADGGEIGSLLVGKTEGPLTYVKLKAAPAVYTIETKQMDEIRKAPSEIPG